MGRYVIMQVTGVPTECLLHTWRHPASYLCTPSLPTGHMSTGGRAT